MLEPEPAKQARLTEADYTDSMGRKFRVLASGESEAELSQGIIIGPPFLNDLGLPRDLEIRLNNELFARKLFTLRDVMRRGGEVESAIRAALKLDVQTLMNMYRE